MARHAIDGRDQKWELCWGKDRPLLRPMAASLVPAHNRQEVA